METTKTSNFTCQSKYFISIFFTCQVSACELEPFSCHDLANDIYSQTAKLCSATLSNDDGDGSENGKNPIGLDSQNNIFARASRFFVHYLAVVARLQRESA